LTGKEPPSPVADRAFAAPWADFDRWSVGSFLEVTWHWPAGIIQSLGNVLSRRIETVDRAEHSFGSLQLLTLHFDGEMEARDLRGKAHFKGRLFFAHPGDVVFSKIDVRNGAVGIVPEGLAQVAFSSEYFVELAGHIWMQAGGTNHDEKLRNTQKRMEQVATWLGHDGLRWLQSNKPLGRQLLDIYAEVEKRTPKNVFLARWYPTAGQGEALQRAQYRLDQIRATLADLERTDGVRLNLIDMGTQSALVTPIHAEMYNAIKSADIILCDLSGVRPNVCVEAGFALYHHHQGRLVFLFEPSAEFATVPFDLNTYRYLPVPQAAAIPGLLKPAILEIMANAARGAI
jgi:hypothetical protein